MRDHAHAPQITQNQSVFVRVCLWRSTARLPRLFGRVLRTLSTLPHL